MKAKVIPRSRILLADDDLPMLAAVGKLLQAEFDVIQTVSDGNSLVEAALRYHPDIIVTDISMPNLSGIEAIRKISGVLPGIKYFLLTAHDTSAYRKEAQSLGVSGFVLKSAAPAELNQAIHDAMQGTSS